MKPSPGRVDKVGNFFLRLLRIRCMGHAPWFLHGLNEEEPQRGQPLRDGACGEFPLALLLGKSPSPLTIETRIFSNARTREDPMKKECCFFVRETALDSLRSHFKSQKGQ